MKRFVLDHKECGYAFVAGSLQLRLMVMQMLMLKLND